MANTAKNQMIVESVLAGRSRAATAKQYGVSKVWVSKLVTRYHQGGFDALQAKSCANSPSIPHATTNPPANPPADARK